MARLFDDGSTQYLSNGSAPATVIPLTLAAWAKTNDLTVSQDILSIGNISTLDFFRIGFRETSDLAEAQIYDGTYAESSFTTASYSANTWHHVCGTFVTDTERNVFLDGGNKGTNTTDQANANINATRIGYAVNNTQPFSGSIAEAAIWTVELTDAEIVILALGYSPLLVRPQSLVAYWPLIGRTSPEIDRVSPGYPMTLVNGPITAAHPPIVYPSSYQRGLTIPGAPPAGAIIRQLQNANLGASLYNGTLIG